MAETMLKSSNKSHQKTKIHNSPLQYCKFITLLRMAANKEDK